MATATHAPNTTEHDACGRWPAFETVEETVKTAGRVFADARHATEDFAADATAKVRERPLTAVSLAVGAGALTGGLVGFTCGWFKGRRHHA